MIMMVIRNGLEEDSRDLREDYPCNYISALTKSRGKIQP
jgi:hypothetical protein